MTDDFVTRLQLQLRAAAEREARSGAFGQALRGMRWRLSAPALATGLAVLVTAVAVAAGALVLRGEPEPAGPHVVARLELTGNPEQIGSAFGSMWIADPVAGEVVRVDPASRRVTARIPVGSAQQLELERVGGELWVVGPQPTEAVRIDPETNAVAGRAPFRTPAGRPFLALRVFAAPAGVWAVGDEGALRIAPGPRTLVSPPTSASQSSGAAVSADDLWSLRSNGRIERFDAATGERLGAFRPGLAGTFFIAGLGGDLIALGEGTIARLDGRDGRVIWERTLGEHVNRFDTAEGLIWVHTTTAREPDRLTAITAESGRTVASTTLDTFGATGLAVNGSEIWIDTPGGTTLVLRR
jgi:PQQ-like domain